MSFRYNDMLGGRRFFACWVNTNDVSGKSKNPFADNSTGVDWRSQGDEITASNTARVEAISEAVLNDNFAAFSQSRQHGWSCHLSNERDEEALCGFEYKRRSSNIFREEMKSASQIYNL
jgi:hypothetical protein